MFGKSPRAGWRNVRTAFQRRSGELSLKVVGNVAKLGQLEACQVKKVSEGRMVAGVGGAGIGSKASPQVPEAVTAK